PAPTETEGLAHVPLFGALPPAQLAALSLRAAPERYPPGTVIVRQGEPADKLYVIDQGEVEVVVEDRRGELWRVAQLKANSYFGEIALLAETPLPRTATVRALTPVQLYSLHKDDFLSLLGTQPELAAEVAQRAQVRLDETRQIIERAGKPSGADGPPVDAPAPAAPSAHRAAKTLAPAATLTIRQGADRGHTYVVDSTGVVLGRAQTNAVPLRDNTISRRHCQITWEDDGYVLRDLDSSNGTYLNGDRIESALLRDNDLIQVGDHVLQFRLVI
ncbi:MAG TPA: cyclic nucleotide-binding domain-containing protein, partial [Chloroflexota bacterium]|nr:cyclic nucleotide-binding domain-containing protein [Chloroflexota bacterium]